MVYGRGVCLEYRTYVVGYHNIVDGRYRRAWNIYCRVHIYPPPHIHRLYNIYAERILYTLFYRARCTLYRCTRSLARYALYTDCSNLLHDIVLNISVATIHNYRNGRSNDVSDAVCALQYTNIHNSIHCIDCLFSHCTLLNLVESKLHIYTTIMFFYCKISIICAKIYENIS